MAISMQNGFNKGFFNYRKAIDKQFNDNLINNLANYYDEKQEWDDLIDNRYEWHEIINKSSVNPENSFRRQDRQLPRAKGRSTPVPRRNSKRKNRLSDHRSARLLPPVNLFDKNKSFIIGMHSWKDEEIVFAEIKNKGHLIGYLGTLKNDLIHDKQDELFSRNFHNMLLKVGLLMMVLAILITFPITKYFTHLIQLITNATKQMAAGDYSIRVQSERKDELGLLASNFNLLAQSLESSAKSQKTMIADIAHELRTPISVIVGEIEAIQDGVHPSNENNLNLLHAQISSLKNLVNDLHDLSESDLGSLKYKMQKFDIMDLIKNCIHNHKASFDKKAINLEMDNNMDECIIIGDSNRLNQLFNNLLCNSVQYTNQGGSSKVVVKMVHNEMIFTIADSAPNLDNASVNKVFERWYRDEQSRNKNTGGSGLGLAICKEIIKAHNGKISASTSDLGGLKFTVTLPIKDVI